MASYKILGLLAIASSMFAVNVGETNAQVSIGRGKSNGLSPAQEILIEMQQTNAPAIGGGSMQLLRFTDTNVSFAPLEGLDRLFNWQISDDTSLTSQKTMGDRIAKFKLEQLRQIASDSQMLEAINRIYRPTDK
ncbi:MAG: hypothetical protein IM516_09845 [Pseudanabaena sp. M158S2SP1A06QC]|jgi:hypothetical protein|uniref:hypothetical protein n=1 Tax=Pseudanabaena mucicola TaxID=71190 RepID=UPI0025786A08|nr:hypothetical protein [Pseudanabaena mucicola]MCA6585534.1 hypothetical protein [Pseudanabaena sp. M051S1SP1A06QC]MCA6589548.1 hypothetical protein [Pseudanabaena sp. M109S1SP1A06QC]MCA6598265.1 hypothetical protein [Pseudanabaena sp. M046S1SP1A06QC]MCA6604544.1 hypothetical protein [Pseudanabaena sp. M007S1SP1A06QC]MCA6612387.1 hypothetical protein [Pseudanabaena sp. M158S2SP1A06QC]MCA6615777.1 hypothetical protein [Pseudanabaena sp. M090S1SP1A06QC]MCA6624994.1 hypothetical protein [Pseud